MLDRYFANLKALGRSENTLRTYKQQLKMFFRWAEEMGRPIQPEEITSIDAVEYRDYLQEAGKMPATINKALQSIEALCVWMTEEKVLDHNPLARVKKVEEVQDAPKWLDKKEKYRLLRVVVQEKDPRKKAIIFVGVFAGLRAMEIIELKPEDISIGERKGTIVVRKGKGNKRRVVPIPAELRECLSEYIYSRSTAEWLFNSQRGEKLTYMGLYQMVLTLGEKAKIPELTPHVLRHTYCHDLIEKGVSIDLVAKLAGHGKIETTMLYTMPGEQELQAAVEKLNLS